VVVPHASQSRDKYQQRDQRHWHHHITNCLWLTHFQRIEPCPLPQSYSRCRTAPKGYTQAMPPKAPKASVRLLQRFLHHRHAFFDALAQRALHFLLALPQSEHFIGDVESRKHRNFQ
jgi:hypothetical protein